MTRTVQYRIILNYQNTLYSLCKLAFVESDSSIYLFPYAIERKYYFGGRSMRDTIFTDTFQYKDGAYTENVPKLSIHESGQVHIKSNIVLAGPIYIPQLKDWRGQHLATVCPDSFTSIPIHTDPLKTSGKTIDKVIEVKSSITNLRLALYLAGDQPSFETPNISVVINLRRKKQNKPLYIGLKFAAQDNLAEGKYQGITIIAGWNPVNIREEGVDYLYIRGT